MGSAKPDRNAQWRLWEAAPHWELSLNPLWVSRCGRVGCWREEQSGLQPVVTAFEDESIVV